jgi:hypothetical protein
LQHRLHFWGREKVSPNKGLRNAGRRRCGPLRLVLCEARWPPCSNPDHAHPKNPDHAHPKNDGYECQLQGSLLARRTKAAGSGGSNQSWLVYAGRGPQPYMMQVGSRHRLGGRNGSGPVSASVFFDRGLFVHKGLMLAPIEVSLSRYLGRKKLC